jgi:hypothetical protein
MLQEDNMLLNLLFILALSGPNHSVKYCTAMAKPRVCEVRTGGSRAWRNNNPGNIGHSPSSKYEIGIVLGGNEGTGEAVFATKLDGEIALANLLSRDYWTFTIPQMTKKYAPLNADNYATFLLKQTGSSRYTKLRDLSEEEMQKLTHGIEKFEGWVVGHIRVVKEK